jgi:hypothetical protein
MFHASWKPGHGHTNYTQYFLSGPGEVYKTHTYSHSYEPYAIFRRDTPWCDERFIGYGANKAACLYELYLSGVSFYVLADDFIIHQSHKYAEKARKHEVRQLCGKDENLLMIHSQRKYNSKFYNDVRRLICLYRCC